MGRKQELVERLIEQTRAGQVSWSTTDVEHAFVVSRPSGSVIIEKDPDKRDVVVRMTNAEGTEILEFGPSRAEWEEAMLEDPDPPRPRLEELYALARAQALHVEETIDNFLRELA